MKIIKIRQQMGIQKSIFWLALLSLICFEAGNAQGSGEMDHFGDEFTQVEETHEGKSKPQKVKSGEIRRDKAVKDARGRNALSQRKAEHEHPGVSQAKAKAGLRGRLHPEHYSRDAGRGYR